MTPHQKALRLGQFASGAFAVAFCFIDAGPGWVIPQIYFAASAVIGGLTILADLIVASATAQVVLGDMRDAAAKAEKTGNPAA